MRITGFFSLFTLIAIAIPVTAQPTNCLEAYVCPDDGAALSDERASCRALATTGRFASRNTYQTGVLLPGNILSEGAGPPTSQGDQSHVCPTVVAKPITCKDREKDIYGCVGIKFLGVTKG
jgi:hypothetical protein